MSQPKRPAGLSAKSHLPEATMIPLQEEEFHPATTRVNTLVTLTSLRHFGQISLHDHQSAWF